MRERLALLLLILCFLAAMKWEFNPGIGRNALDGSYFYQVARNVEEGRGFVTDVSLYHQGLKELPAPATIYPLWPYLLGWTGRLISLPNAATILPELLYLVDLVLLYFLALRIKRRFVADPDPFLLRGGTVFDVGHAAVLLLAFNPVFFYFTSVPYTEGVAFALIFGAFLALDRLDGHRWPVFGALAGLLAAAAFLARSQMLLSIVAACGCFLLAGLRRPRVLKAGALYAGVAALTILPWLLYLLSLVKPFDPRVLFYFQRFRETPEIAPFLSGVATDSLWAFVVDRAPGLVAAFNPWEEFSFVASFGLAAWLAPLALFYLLSHRTHLAAGLRELFAPRSLAVKAILFSGLLMVAPLFLNHSRFLWPWRFHHRHGLPLLFVLLVALCYLLSYGGKLVRRSALALVAASVAWGCFATIDKTNDRFASGLIGPEPELVQWLDSQTPRPTVLTTNPQALSVFSRSGFHWMECREGADKTRQMLELLPIDYVLVYAGEERCAFAEGARDLDPVRSFGEGRLRIDVYGAR